MAQTESGPSLKKVSNFGEAADLPRRSHILAAVDVGAQVFKLETFKLWWVFGDIESKASCDVKAPSFTESLT